MEEYNISKEYVDSTLLVDVAPIEECCEKLKSREDLARLVEVPLREACLELYDKNIETMSSSANQKNVDGEAIIVVNFDSLSEENRQIAKDLDLKVTTNQGIKQVYITSPISSATTVGDIKKGIGEKVSQFKQQPLTWGISTLEELKAIYRLGPEVEVTPKDMEEATSMVYDPETKLFYLSEELLKKGKAN